MRIGIVCHASVGGSGRVAIELAAQLAKRGHRVHLFTLAPLSIKNQSLTENIELHVSCPAHQSSSDPFSLYTHWSAEEKKQLIDSVKTVVYNEGLEVLHFHYAVPFAMIAAEIKTELNGNCPLLIGTLHGTDVLIHGRDQVTGARLQQALSTVDAVTAVSQCQANLSQQILHLSPSPAVIPNFIDLSRYNLQNRTGRSKPAKIMHVSNFRAIKKPVDVVHIFAKIRQHIDAELWLVGNGEQMETVRKTAQQAGIEDDVRYWGLVNDTTPYLKQADLLLITSRYESFCLAALEAMACGVPILASDVGGLPEVVQHEKSGFLYPVGDHHAAAQMALELLTQPARWETFQAAAFQRASTFAAEKVVPLYENLYSEIMGSA